MKILTFLALLISTSTFAGSLSKKIVKHQNIDRMFLKYTPTGWKKGNPVLFVLHGGHGSAGRMASEANFRKIADLKRILLIYPNGTGRDGLGLTTNAQWNDGRNATTFPHARGIDDVGFLRKIASRLRATGEAVSSNIFVTGVSNGGMMTQRLLCQASDVFSGGAAVIANMPLHLINNCRPRIARPVMIMNGTADSLMPYYGGVVGAQYGLDLGDVISARSTYNKFRQINGCYGREEVMTYPDKNRLDRSTVDRFRAKSCTGRNQVVLLRVNNGGHNLPGSASGRGKKNKDIDGATEIWNFLSQFASYPRYFYDTTPEMEGAYNW